MKTKTTKFENFETDKLPGKQLKTVLDGDTPIDEKDPIKGTGNTGGNG